MTDAVQRAERVAERIAARAARYDLAAEFPVEDLQDLRAEGLLGLMVPTALGGMGAGFEEYVRVAVALARGGGSTALVFNMHASVTGGLASIPEQMAVALGVGESFFATRERVLRAAARGSVYGVAISEPDVGSRLSALRSTYEPEGDGFRIQGVKSTVSGAGHLDAYLVAARREGTGSGDPVLSYFLVPQNEGLSVERTWDPLGMRATASNALTLDTHVPAEALLGGVEGLVLPLAHAMPQWLVASYAAVYVGLAQAAVDEAVAYLRGRTVAGRRGGLAHLGSVRARVGRAEADALAARLTLEHAARLVELQPGDPETNRWVFRAKLLAGDAAMRAAASLAEACGLGALQRGSPLERIFRDARSGSIMPPPSDVSAEYLGAAALGVEDEVRPW
ncbi:MAG TPA: acyl-CoA dehydrogenase family protein [Actinomycetota bacterium]|nr:acyl-CoA dehydrogenase family protein [Actinomycetota bacterium]